MAENDEVGKGSGNGESPSLFWGRVACGIGIILAVLGIVAALFGTGASVVPGALGICFGILGYFLGSNRLGTATIIICTAVLFFGLAASQGQIPGIDASDRSLPDEEPRVN